MDIESKLTDFPDGITAIDTDYVRPRLDASHLLVDNGRAAFVDTGTTLSVPNLLAALDARGIGREQVDWVLTTHVHLDHAGGAGELMRHLPNARCAVHPRGARHLVDPTKLIAGSITVYGETVYRRLYGAIVPIPEERIFIPGDGERITVGQRNLELIHTRGHALHHYCIVDLDTRRIFTGDNFGVSYRDFDVNGREFIFPTTTPVHFDPEAMHASIDRLMAYRPIAMYLTHYSQVLQLERLAIDLKRRIDAVTQLARSLVNAPDRASRLRSEMFVLMSAWLDEHGYPGRAAERHRLIDADIDLNAQGLEVWLDRA
jgi:glyoxylase-like metal-dependent hydrolase (beta-lactamase superfamily II)